MSKHKIQVSLSDANKSLEQAVKLIPKQFAGVIGRDLHRTMITVNQIMQAVDDTLPEDKQAATK